MKKQTLSGLTSLLLIAICLLTIQNVNAQSWNLTGNAGTSASTNFIGTTDSVAFKIRTKNAVRMTVTAAGKVGIGTPSPVNKLSVAGTGDFTGNVGIGISIPTAPLHISSNSNGATPQFLLYEADNDYARINFQNNTGSSYWAVGGYNNTLQENERFTIYNSKAGADLFAITGDGRVAIGTTTIPLAKLDVTDHSYAGLVNLDGASSMTISLKENGVYRGYLGSFSGAAEDVDFGTGIGNTTGAVNFTIQAIPKMSIVSSGRVGISTTTPQAKLHISHNSTTSIPQLLLYESESDFARLSFKNNSSSSYWSIAGLNSAVNADERLNFWNSTTGDVMSLTGNGSVCIGTGTPATGYKLSVNGKIICEEMKVQLHANWPDYVFADSYSLLPLEELEKFTVKNGHLPGIPSSAAVKAEGGIELGEMQTKLLEKIEELTLYVIRQDKEIGLLKDKLHKVQDIEK